MVRYWSHAVMQPHSDHTYRREEVCEHDEAVQADVVVAEPQAAQLNATHG
jgi:hypothetical protein